MLRCAIGSTIRMFVQAGGREKTMRNQRRDKIILFFLSLCLLAGCNSTQPAAPAQRYTLTGKIESVDKAMQTINVNGDAIPGFMPAMTMSYKVKNQNEFNQLSAGDTLSADIVKQQGDYWLENVKVTQHGPTVANPPSNTK
jgi:Cu/Ag efflux protein CusF